MAALEAVYPPHAFYDPADWPLARWLDALVLGLIGDDAPTIPNAALSTASLLNDLAGYRQGCLAAYAQARPFYERALEIREKALGPDHPETATSLNNLAFLLQTQGDLPGARLLYERALAIREKAFGPDHPETATSLNNLAFLLQTEGDLPGARPLYERALALWENVLGPNHPNTNRGYRNLARLLLESGNPAEAAIAGERALVAHETALGAAHVWTTDSVRVTADAWEALGQRDEAAELRRRFGLS